MTDVAIEPRLTARRAEVRAFMEKHVYPSEPVLAREDEAADALMVELRAKAKAAGIWAPHLPPEAGGSGSGFIEYALLNEEIGRSTWAQLVFNCQAPDAGNGEILHMFGTEEQKEQFLKPLVEGTARSFFSMTEPEVSGADPTQLRTTAVLDGDEWVIDGHKWFTSNGLDADFFIVMCRTEDDGGDRNGAMTQIIVPADTPGVEIIRGINVWGRPSDHCEIVYDGVRVPLENALGDRGTGHQAAQDRLGAGRVYHCMNSIGAMWRAFDLMVERATQREVHGGLLETKQLVQQMIADSYMDVQSARLMTIDCAEKMAAGQDARTDISAIKVFVPAAFSRVVDRAIQVWGAAGVTGDLPLQAMYTGARTLRIADGPDEVHRILIAKNVLAQYRDGERGWDFGS